MGLELGKNKGNHGGCVNTQQDVVSTEAQGLRCWARSHVREASSGEVTYGGRDKHKLSQNSVMIVAVSGESATSCKAYGLVVSKGQESKLQDGILWVC